MRWMMLRLAVASLAACTRAHAPAVDPERPAGGGAAAESADSIVLERTFCFGTCPAYRLSITHAGYVHFQSRNPGDSTAASARIAPAQFERLLAEARQAGFWSLPPRIADVPSVCGPRATDHPGAIVTIFAGADTKRVDDYHGCHGDLTALRRFESRIDSVAGSERWVRPARIR